jgi:hypothetical protein
MLKVLMSILLGTLVIMAMGTITILITNPHMLQITMAIVISFHILMLMKTSRNLLLMTTMVVSRTPTEVS